MNTTLSAQSCSCHEKYIFYQQEVQSFVIETLNRHQWHRAASLRFLLPVKKRCIMYVIYNVCSYSCDAALFQLFPGDMEGIWPHLSIVMCNQASRSWALGARVWRRNVIMRLLR